MRSPLTLSIQKVATVLQMVLAVSSVTVAAPEAQAHGDNFEHGWTAIEKQAAFEQPLSLASIRQLALISARLRDLAGHDPTACSWMNQITGPETLARQVAAFDTNTAVRKAIDAAGMTVRDYLLTIHAVSEAARVVYAAENGVALAATTSSRNIAFYRAHRTEIETLLDAPDPC